MLSKGCVLDVANQLGGAMPSVVTLHDWSRYGNDGTFAGGLSWLQLASTGLWVLDHDDTNDRIAIPHSASLAITTEPFTITVWVTPHNVTGNHYLAYKGVWAAAGWGLARINASIRYFDFVASAVFDVPNAFVANQTTFVCMRKDGTDLRFYIDGEQLGAAQVVTADMGIDATIMHLGHAAENWYGYMSLFRFYRYALTPAQIRARYHSTKWLFGVAS